MDKFLEYQGTAHLVVFTLALGGTPIPRWIHERYGYYGGFSYIVFWYLAITAGLALLGLFHFRENRSSSSAVIFGVVINAIYAALAILMILVMIVM